MFAPTAHRFVRVVGASVTTLILTATTLTVAGSPAQAASYSAPLRTAISQLPVAAEVRTGYDRSLFPHWKDANGDCQDARAEVLISESSVTPTYTSSSKCSVSKGKWFSYYDRVTWTLASDVDIDHMVALAEAWDSGARNWTTSRRQAYANDLDDYRSLVGVTDNVNQAKGDQDPATWLPTYDRCRYLLDWTAVKVRWRLSVDSAEKNALTSLGNQCNNVTLNVTTV